MCYQSFKFELIPNDTQRLQMCRFAGACRYVFNHALALQEKRLAQGLPRLSFVELCKQLTVWRSDSLTSWLTASPVHTLQQALKNLDSAYANFTSKKAFAPRFKKKGKRDSFRFPDSKQFKLDQSNARLKLPKLGWLRFRKSREVLGTVRSVTVSLCAGKWFASILTERETAPPISDEVKVVGVDVGIARFATLSDGSFFEPVNSYRKNECRLRKARQALSRKTKFGKNWTKAKEKVQRIDMHIANSRRDFIHKVTASICKKHAVVCLSPLLALKRIQEQTFGARQD